MKRRRGALLGFGNVSEYGHLPAWLARRDVELVAVADADPLRRDHAAVLVEEAQIYEDPIELLDREKLDFVDIATPPASHASLAVAAAEAGFHILCEKPLATTAEDFERVANAARDAKVAIVTVHNWKHSIPFLRLRDLLAEGTIGTLRRIEIETVRSVQSVTVGDPWRGQAAVAGGGILVDHGWHAFYLMMGFAGKAPRAVSATVDRKGQPEAEVEDTAACRIELGPITGEIHLTWAGTERRTRWQLDGESGTIELIDDRLEIRRGDSRETSVLAESLSAGSHHPEWFGSVIDEFLREIDTTPRKRGANLLEAERCFTLLRLAYASAAQQGCRLEIPKIAKRK